MIAQRLNVLPYSKKKIVVEQTVEEKGKEEKGSLKFANDISRRVVETDI